MTNFVVIVFAIVYLGMFLGGLPRLHLDRTGVALLGAIAIVGAGVMMEVPGFSPGLSRAEARDLRELSAASGSR